MCCSENLVSEKQTNKACAGQVWGLTRAVVPGPQLGNLVNRKVQIESSQRGLPDSKRKECGLIRISFPAVAWWQQRRERIVEVTTLKSSSEGIHVERGWKSIKGHLERVVKLMKKITDFQEFKGAQNEESHSTECLLGGFLLLVNEAGFEPATFGFGG